MKSWHATMERAGMPQLRLHTAKSKYEEETSQGRYYYSHFIDEEIEAQADGVIHSRPPAWQSWGSDPGGLTLESEM